MRAFSPQEVADEILKINVNLEGGPDYVRWPFTRYGHYSVRSAYNMARTNLFLLVRSANGGGQNSGWPLEDKMWKKIWNIKVPNKMKILVWRFVHNCLPSGEQLQRRQVPTRTDCVFCGRAEGIEHALLFCGHARLV